MIKILLIIAGILYGALNVVTSKLLSAKEMKESYINGQCVVGKICANIFYAPAWFLKGLRCIVLALVK